MPRLSVWMIRTALLALAAGAALGALLLADPAPAGGLARWRPLHAELLLVGWTVQFALGVAYWILPRFREGRGREELAWAAFVLVNLGVLLVGAGRPAAGRGAEAMAAVAFAAHAWPRVKPFR